MQYILLSTDNHTVVSFTYAHEYVVRLSTGTSKLFYQDIKKKYGSRYIHTIAWSVNEKSCYLKLIKY